ncbi:MAG: hypothetical protein FWF51_04200 [Chitinivibrionia bacterium]|nr:hypothetical protein [Chitinivibrionia bacterium]
MFKRLFGLFGVAVLVTALFLACSPEQETGTKYEYEGGGSGSQNSLRYSVTLRGTVIENGTVEKRGERYVISMKWLKTYQGKADEIVVGAVGNFSGEEATDIYLLFQGGDEYIATNISDWRTLRASRGVRSIIRSSEDVEITQADMDIVAEKFQAAFDAKTDLATIIPEVGDGVKLVDNYPVIIINPGDIDLRSYNFQNAYTPKLECLIYENGKIYAAVQFMGGDSGWDPIANSQILEINAQTGAVLRKFESNFMNVAQIQIRGGDLWVVDGGSLLSNNDGGITKINLSSGVKTTISLMGNETYDPMKLVFLDDTKGYLLVYDSDWWSSYLAEFTLSGNTMSVSYEKFDPEEDFYSVNDISYNGETNDLWIGNSNTVYRYSITEDAIKAEIDVTMPVYSMKSVANTTLIVETNYTAGVFGIIANDIYTQKETIDGDAVCDFVDGNFYILERGNDAVIKLNESGNIINQKPIDSDIIYFNPRGIVGDGSGNLWLNSYEEVFIKVWK